MSPSTKSRHHHILRTVFLAGSVALASGTAAHATSSTWNTTSGNWSTPASWAGSLTPGATTGTTNTDTATFASSGNGTVTVDANRNLKNITFSATGTSSYTLTGGSLVLTTGGSISTGTATLSQTVNTGMTLEGLYSFTSGATSASNILTIGGNVTAGAASTLTLAGSNTGNNIVSGIISNGAGANTMSVTKANAGTWILSGANTYTGATTLNQGTLNITGSGTLGGGTAALTTGYNNVASTLDLGGTSQTVGAVTLGGTGASGSATIQNGSLTGTSYSATNTGGTITVSANLLGSTVALSKSGAGNLVLSGTNSYGGGTTVSGGILQAATTNALPNYTNAALVTAQSGGAIVVQAGNGTDWSSTNIDTLLSNGVTTFNAGSGFGINTDDGNFTYGTSMSLSQGVTFFKTGANNLTLTGTNNFGTGGITVAGATGTLTLNGANTYSGVTTLNGGSLIVGNAAALGTTSAFAGGTVADYTFATTLGSLTINAPFSNGSRFKIGSAAANGNITFNGAFTNSGGVTNALNGAGTSTVTFNGPMYIDSGASQTSTLLIQPGSGQTFVINGAIADSNGFSGDVANISIGASGSIVSLFGANTWSGTTVLGRGTVNITSFGSLGSTSSSLGAPTTTAADTLTLGASGVVTVDYQGSGETTDRILVIGSSAVNSGAIISNDGTGALVFTGSTSSGAFTGDTFTLSGANTAANTFQGALIDNSGTNFLTFTKAGTGRWILSGANTYTGVTSVTGGVLELASANALPGGIGATGGTSNLTINGGVIGLDNGNFTRGLGTGVTQVQLTGAGGFAAYGADRIVNLGGASAALSWGSGSFLGASSTFILGASTADHMVDFQNPISFAGAAHTVQVDDGSAAIDAKLSGVLSSTTASGGLIKTGLGTLQLTGANTYTGATQIQNGALSVSSINKIIGGGTSSNLGAPTTASTGTITLGSTTNTGTLIYTGTGETTDRAISLGGTTGGGTIENDGSGAITFTSAFAEATGGAKTLTLQGSNTGSNTISGIISDNSGTFNTSVTKAGAGTWNLAAVNTYTGATLVSSGILEASTNQAFGTTAAGTSVTSGAEVLLNNVNYSAAEALTINGTGISGGGALVNSGTSTFAGAVTAATDSTINAGGGTLTFTGGLVKNGTKLTLTGGGTVNVNTTGISGSSANSDLIVDGTTANLNVANTYNGPTIIRNGGTINATVATALPTANGRSAIVMDDTGSGSSTLALTNAGQAVASLAGASSSGINLNNQALTVGTTTGTTTFAGTISGTGGSLVKDGASTQVLSGTNTYTGGTTVSAGKLVVNGGTAGSSTASGVGSGAVAVNSGGTLAGSGNIAANVAINSGGTLLSGGAQTGPTVTGAGLTLTNSTATISSATLAFNLGTGTTAGSGPLTYGTPNTNTTFLSLSGSTTMNFTGTDGIALIDLSSGGLDALRLSTPYLLVTAASNADYLNLVIQTGTGVNAVYSLSQNDASVNGFVLGVATGVGTLGSAGSYTPFSISELAADGQTPLTGALAYPNPELVLYNGDLEVVPEPSTWALMLGGVALLVLIQRRRSKV